MSKRIRFIALTLAAALLLALPAAAYGDTAGHWAAKDIDAVTELGLFGGMEDGSFSPDAPMDRSMAVVVLWRLAGRPAYETPHGFPDAVERGWYSTALRWAKRCGIATGDETGRFRPENSVTREELVTLIVRWLSQTYPERFEGQMNTLEFYAASYLDHATEHFTDASTGSHWASAGLGWAIETGTLKGDENGRLRPSATVTRAEAATIFVRVYDLYVAG